MNKQKIVARQNLNIYCLCPSNQEINLYYVLSRQHRTSIKTTDLSTCLDSVSQILRELYPEVLPSGTAYCSHQRQFMSRVCNDLSQVRFTASTTSRRQTAYRIRQWNKSTKEYCTITLSAIRASSSLSEIPSHNHYHPTLKKVMSIQSNYTYERSGDKYDSSRSLRQVETAVQNLKIPFVRHSHVSSEVDQADSSISQHIHELVDRGKLVRAGCRYVHISDLRSFSMLKLKKLLTLMDQEQDRALKKKSRIEDKIRSLREYKRSGDWSGSTHQDLEDDLCKLHDSRSYYENKVFVIKRCKRQVLSAIQDESNSVSEKSGEGSPRIQEEAAVITS